MQTFKHEFQTKKHIIKLLASFTSKKFDNFPNLAQNARKLLETSTEFRLLKGDHPPNQKQNQNQAEGRMNTCKTKQYLHVTKIVGFQKDEGVKLTSSKRDLDRCKVKPLTPGGLRHCLIDDRKKKKVRICREKEE